MNAIEQIIEVLKQNPQVRYEFRADAIRALAPDSNGYEVALLMHANGSYTVCLATWHMEFTDEYSAVGTFLSGLTDDYRLKVASRGNVDYRWTIQYREPDGWKDGSTVGLLRYKFWRRRRIRYLQNHMVSFPEPQQRSQYRRFTRLPSVRCDGPVGVESLSTTIA